ncbi:hypothetical protein PUR34_02495 [Streptomyces sp. JV185]|uniref:hypothetical protein n=1 Tax=Streptomyces sp. JV185 TaxID=858638 RepID=UPI002E76A4D5|nr:hypothetical protein [Streptomyces sp. JV185]MEE1767083.1 hypothetical protein [Streptomyces sp. JV185]
MQEKRAEEYGRCATVLNVDFQVPGAAAIFDQALTNGLAAIVAHTWQGEESEKRRNGDHRLKVASQLLKVIAERCDEAQEGIRLVPDTADESKIAVDVAALSDALEQTQRVRHARGVGEIEKRHVAALLDLDDHSCLRQVSEERRESDWVKHQIQDRYERLRAQDHLDMIGEVEADRRIALAADHRPTHPDDVIDGMDVTDCPVCGRETLAVSGIDDFGVGYGPGVCLVCSYVRSSDAAHGLALNQMLARHTDD